MKRKVSKLSKSKLSQTPLNKLKKIVLLEMVEIEKILSNTSAIMYTHDLKQMTQNEMKIHLESQMRTLFWVVSESNKILETK